MADVVPEVADVVGAVPTEVVVVAQEVVPVVEAAATPVVKTAVDLALGEVGNAALLLSEAKKKAQAIKDALKNELFVKEAEIRAELAKLEQVFVESVTATEHVVEKVISAGVSGGTEILEAKAEFEERHPLVMAAIFFVAGAVISGLTVWGIL